MLKKEKPLTPEEWRKGLRILAENIVTIKQGEKVGRWDRETRVVMVYSILCALTRAKGIKI